MPFTNVDDLLTLLNEHIRLNHDEHYGQSTPATA
jgi:hypothetical protein